MCFDDPIYLDSGSVEDLIDDTDQHRICWMYHDILSDPNIARMFGDYAGKGPSIGEAWTTMAWVAAGRQEDSFFLLFKWYEDFYGPPERCDLYYLDCADDLDGGVRIRFVNMEVPYKLDRRRISWYKSLWSKISDNASSFFGESDFEPDTVQRLIRLLDTGDGRKFEAMDRYFGACSDELKYLQCATIAAYFQGIQAIEEIIYSIVVYDGGNNDIHHMHTKEFLAILNRISSTIDVKRLAEFTGEFKKLARIFCGEPARVPQMNRTAGRVFFGLTESGILQWLEIGGHSAGSLLREFYALSDPRRTWDVFHPWQGEVLFTVVPRPLPGGICRGVYLLTRFEDQTGLDVTDLFWLENVTSGTVHLCQGDFFEELLDEILAKGVEEAILHGGRQKPGTDPVAATCYILKEAHEKYAKSTGSWPELKKEK